MARTRYSAGDGSIERARELRHDPTPAEKRLWSVLRNRRLGDAKFRRQQRLGPYFADFVCHEVRLVVEIDGDTHAGTVAEAKDAARSAFIEREGYRVLRFSNEDVMPRLEGVGLAVLDALAPSPSHSASPSGPLLLPRGGEGN